MSLHYRTVWISDIHLGTKGCKADDLMDFLEHVECDYLYLVGDIIDLWKFKSGFYWPERHNDVVHHIMQKARQGTRVVYIPGNHDDPIRKYHGMHFNGIDIRRNAIHKISDGRKFLILHGDEFDSIACHNKRLAYIGGEAYEFLLIVNRWFNICRSKLGYKYWSLSAYLKHKVKNAVSFIDNYQQILCIEAKKQKVDGIICGHIHHANIASLAHQMTYANCGDWVESCTALVENYEGELAIIHWLEDRQQLLGPETEIQPELANVA